MGLGSRIPDTGSKRHRIHDPQHWLLYTLRLDVVNKENRAREIQPFLSWRQEPAVPGGHAGAGQEERGISVAQAGEAEWTGEGDQELAAAGTPTRGEGFRRQGAGTRDIMYRVFIRGGGGSRVDFNLHSLTNLQNMDDTKNPVFFACPPKSVFSSFPIIKRRSFYVGFVGWFFFWLPVFSGKKTNKIGNSWSFPYWKSVVLPNPQERGLIDFWKVVNLFENRRLLGLLYTNIWYWRAYRKELIFATSAQAGFWKENGVWQLCRYGEFITFCSVFKIYTLTLHQKCRNVLCSLPYSHIIKKADILH